MQQRSWLPATLFRLLAAAILHLHPVERAEVIPPVPPQARETAVLPQDSIDPSTSHISINFGDSE